jgi:uncharacterized protein (DUF736 family)
VIEAWPSFGRIKPSEATWLASGSYVGERWRISWPAQDVGLQERRKRSPSVRKGGYRIVPEANQTNNDAPSHRVYVDDAEIGAAWPKRSKEGREYLSVKVDGPHFGAPAALAKRTNGQFSRQQAQTSSEQRKPAASRAPYWARQSVRTGATPSR